MSDQVSLGSEYSLDYDAPKKARRQPFWRPFDKKHNQKSETSASVSIMRGNLKSKKEKVTIKKITDTTSDVSKQEAENRKIGDITGHLKFMNDNERDSIGVTGTLIHPRLVLTCAHLFYQSKDWINRKAMKAELKANQSFGLDLDYQKNEERYVVKTISESCPFKSQGLQIGDIVHKIQIKYGKKKWKQWSLETIDISAVTATCSVKLEAERILVMRCVFLFFFF